MNITGIIELEGLVAEIQQAGQAWIDSRLRSDQLEADEKSYLAALMNDLEKAFKGEKVSEAKLDRLARGSAEFRAYITGRATATAETGRRKVEYDAKLNLWEAKRSTMAFERAKLERGLFHHT